MRSIAKTFVAAVLAFLSVQASLADFTPPLHVFVSQALTDEFGEVLEGSALEPGDLVQILRTLDGKVEPPDEEGSPAANSEVLHTSAIGHAQPESAARPGKFFVSVPRSILNNLNGSTLFVRVYNAPTLPAATFFGDSAPFAVHSSLAYMEASLERVNRPFRLADEDGDGLVLSWEQTYGASDSMSDSDGNGMGDYEEHLAGTDPSDPDSLLRVARIESQGDDVTLHWASVPGRRYQVEALGTDPSLGYQPLGPVVDAAGAESELTLPDALLEGLSFFRVSVLVEEGL